MEAETAWQQLINGKISLKEAQELLIDEQGNLNLDLFDLEVNRRFERQFRNYKELPPIIPLLLWRNCYYLGSTQPLTPETVRKMRGYTTSDINLKVVRISEKSFRDCSYLQEIDINRVNPTRFVELFKNRSVEDVSTITERYLLQNKSATEQLNIIIAGALHQRASDIHFEPSQYGLRIRYRIDGMLREIVKPRQGIDRRLIIALKVMAKMDIAESRRPLDGRIRMSYAAGGDIQLPLDLRVSTLPCVEGEKAVVRLLPQKNPFSNVNNLGFTPAPLAIYTRWLEQPQGMVIITGPTGSGKTSTLYTSLQMVAKEVVNVVTIEDPVEYVLPGINQSQVLEAAGMTFAAGLRSILRQDPDIIMVGEIRDEETAETAVRAALTGHLVFTTLHTNDSISAIPRLKGLHLEPALIGEAILGIVAQRLVRKICPYCAEPYTPTTEDLEYLGLTPETTHSENWREGQGCAKCNSSGYLGREAIVELLNFDSRVKHLIREGTLSELQRYLNKINFDSFRAAATTKIVAGLTTVKEVKRVLPYNSMHGYEEE